MKKAWLMVLLICMLTGCAEESKEMQRGLALRANILQAKSCSFDAEIIADYGDLLHIFEVSCQADDKGNITFAVIAPESISGITGSVTENGGKLTFDGTALQFDTMADRQISPVSAPWIFLKTLRSGCLTSVGSDGESLRLSMDDSYEENALHLDIWLNKDDIPQRAEILYDGRRIISLNVENFQML